MGIGSWFIERLALPVAKIVRAQMTIVETENNFLVGTARYDASDRERLPFEREEVVRQAIEAWRVNPLARRIVELTTQYVVGSGLRISVEDDNAQKFVDDFYKHPLNKLDLQLSEWCDELSRSGELFLLLSTDAAGFSYVRGIASDMVSDIQTADNDIKQEILYTVKTEVAGQEVYYPSAYNDPGRGVDGAFMPVVLHYAVNRPVGTVRGESDLAPLLRWLSRYSGWLEDRARLNRYRNSFLFVVKAQFASEEERIARQNSLATNPPSPGSILVTDSTEEWSVINPELQSSDAGEDGLALKKMIAAGAGVPMHFLAEPESATRTTAEAAGGPTYRRFEQRQNMFCSAMADLFRVVIARRRMVDASMPDSPRISVTGADLSGRDNAALGIAASSIGEIMQNLRNRQIIDDEELLRMVYRFAGESIDSKEMLKRGSAAGEPKDYGNQGGPNKKREVKISPEGDATGTGAV